MEQNSLNNLPKFESAEEELAFLREHVARREREISGAGQEVTPEQIAKQTIEQYKQIPSEEILPAQKIVSHEEAQGIVLKLKPETHDAKMAEMMHILQERGIKNALSVVEHLNNPHLDDDFHRFLVQYLVSMKKIDGLKSGSALEKSLKMKLFEYKRIEKIQKLLWEIKAQKLIVGDKIWINNSDHKMYIGEQDPVNVIDITKNGVYIEMHGCGSNYIIKLNKQELVLKAPEDFNENENIYIERQYWLEKAKEYGV
jgi:hypothetical protein